MIACKMEHCKENREIAGNWKKSSVENRKDKDQFNKNLSLKKKI